MSKQKIIEKLGITTGELVVRTKIDNSGDREHKSYDILSHFPWGNRGIVYEMENPNEAKLFCAAPEMLEALIEEWVFIDKQLSLWADSIPLEFYSELVNRAVVIVSIIEKATGKSSEEIKEITNG